MAGMGPGRGPGRGYRILLKLSRRVSTPALLSPAGGSGLDTSRSGSQPLSVGRGRVPTHLGRPAPADRGGLPRPRDGHQVRRVSARIPAVATGTGGGGAACRPGRALAPAAPGSGCLDTAAGARGPTGLCPRHRVAAGARRSAARSDGRARPDPDQLQARGLRPLFPGSGRLPHRDPA